MCKIQVEVQKAVFSKICYECKQKIEEGDYYVLKYDCERIEDICCECAKNQSKQSRLVRW